MLLLRLAIPILALVYFSLVAWAQDFDTRFRGQDHFTGEPGNQNYDDFKAPPPDAKPYKPILPRKRPATHNQALVNEIVEKENLPYIMIEGYDLKIAINPSVLAAHGLKSGDKVTAEKMYQIIDADREFQRQLLK